ncbi:putative 18S rRNA (guanine-N(7))-methyltransferase [Orchesella cincta]|uniref:Putative 18S rRNA (Guanine-N(7))-methyltransferase n=1 Tax=Orchesella cincta TaxID=48709 RepID=A0A1D2MYG7_ORCCI|nr:putative 18S rRNA (guanine-N(7))-methyltransferase [Orchesella cincta]
MSLSKRPEGVAPPEIFYNDDEARKYTQNSRNIEIQEEMTNRCIELLEIDDDDGETRLVLDIGCGSGLSGECLDERGHVWVGIDISQSMLNVALEREVEGDLVLADMGEGLPFRAGTFDYAISVSALQWLCNKDKAAHNPIQRLSRFFTSLYAVLVNALEN